MRWSKIKNIIIVLLVILNASLLALVGLQAWNSGRMARQTRERMAQVLERNGIGYLPAEVPGEMELLPLRIAVTPPGPAQAEVLLGTVTERHAAGARTTYVGERGSADLTQSGEIRATLPITVQNGPEGETLSPSEEDILALLASLGTDLRRLEPSSGRAGTQIWVPLWRGQPVFGRPVELSRRADAWQLELRLLAGEEEQGVATGEPISAPTALARFLEELDRGGYVCNQVTQMYAGYMASGSATVTLTPCWFIETDAWPWRFAVNSLSAQVTPEVF